VDNRSRRPVDNLPNVCSNGIRHAELKHISSGLKQHELLPLSLRFAPQDGKRGRLKTKRPHICHLEMPERRGVPHAVDVSQLTEHDR
jgi:hypothetical protein